MSGFVYAIESGGRVKIGYSAKPDQRFSKVASDAPFPCELLGYWPGTVADELDIHAKFNGIRVHGEWFAATAELLAFVAQHVVPTRKQTAMPRGCEPAASLIVKFGSVKELAEAAGTTIHAVGRWRREKGKGGTGGTIPHWHVEPILAAANERGLELTAADFFSAKLASQFEGAA
ncbi:MULTISPECIES: GIY-YIG nuclease family protein [unclassified Shinella]|uniref:GIY-YIG nuclease family protein n=1 Tax=unclassified Shinella TaxID=2643062 RepID=UPI00234EF67A|nr:MULTISPECIES: GIY-YIG nuclease family protein [unclassified Shinella]MCO5152546.1 GIY-YIG nuclease family protein [Shinella sp.]MDC7261839.1 GIY-YIG nuclease family protein [Shinella sp. HY16]MDC7268734.1 GIY-YIG nuclease family protein [Shinella sp. YZ44]